MSEAMKHVSTKKLVALEEHAVTVSARELVEMLVAGDPTNLTDPRDVSIQVTMPVPPEKLKDGKNKAGSREAMTASTLLEIIRAHNEEIPEDAEVVVGVRWRKEVEVSNVQTGRGAPTPMMMMPAPGQQAYTLCGTCGAIPQEQGPTPDCNDPNGCGPIRARHGAMPVPTAVVPQQENWVGGSAPRPQGPAVQVPQGRAVNRETGEVAFLDKDGMPYGKHEYVNDRFSRRDI